MSTAATPLPYTVYVDDNYHYQDEEHRYRLGEFASIDEAVAACKRVVDEYLQGDMELDMSADDLYTRYVHFGEDPFIVGADGVPFSAWSLSRAGAARTRGDRPG
jgi:hypothetical protein